MESFSLHTGSKYIYWEDNPSCIYVVEAEIVTPRFKNIGITVFFLQEKFGNGLYVPKYDKFGVM